MSDKEQQKIHEIMDSIIDIRHKDAEQARVLCFQLKELAESLHNIRALCFSFVYLSDSYYGLGLIDKGIKAGRKALRLLSRYNDMDLLLVQCNLLGILYGQINDEQSAMEYYFKGLKLAKNLNNNMLLGAIYSNLGTLYLRQGAYTRSSSTFKHAYEALISANSNNQNINLTIENYTNNLAYVEYCSGNYEKANQLNQSILKNITPEENYPLYCNCIQLNAQINCKLHHYDITRENITFLLSAPCHSMNPLSLFEYYTEIINICIDCTWYNPLEDLFQKAYILAKEIALPNKWILYYDLLIQYTQLIDDKKRLNESLENYYNWSIKQDEYLLKSKLRRVKNRAALYKAKALNEKISSLRAQLKTMVSLDELTKVANRYGLNEYLSQTFSLAKSEHLMFTAILLDIDYFKQYNDSYGHLCGDECLKTIGSLLTDIIKPHGFVARYGGDEFLLITLNKSKEEVEAIASSIRKEVMALKIENKKSVVSDYVTVTMGIAHQIPALDSDVEDFIYAADNALYNVKNKSRDGFNFYDYH